MTGSIRGLLSIGMALNGTVGKDTTNPEIPLIKKVSISPIQQHIAAVNDDKTLSFALHGVINSAIEALQNVTNYNADTIQLIVETLQQYGILVKRIDAIEAAQAAADAAQAAAIADQALINSYTSPTVVVSAQTQADGTAAITIQAHQRIYADPGMTTVTVTGGTITGLALSSQYYIYYDDLGRKGGVVDFKYTTDNTVAAQTHGRHSLGGVATGGATDTDPIDGGGVAPPGSSRVPPYKRLPNQAEE